MTTCTSCGAENAAAARFCVRCGAPLMSAPPPESWRYSGDLEQPRAEPTAPPPPSFQAPPPAQYEPPAVYQPSQPSYAPPAFGSTFQPQGAPGPAGSGQLAQATFVLGIVTASVMALGLIPCLGWMNYFTLLIGKVTILLAVVAIVTEKDPNLRNKAVIGLCVAAGAWVIGLVRLVIGGGCV
jgi:zinc-ribbon domain